MDSGWRTHTVRSVSTGGEAPRSSSEKESAWLRTRPLARAMSCKQSSS